MRTSNLIPLLAAIPSVMAVPRQPEIRNTTTLPTHFGILLFPHFQALDVFGPLDVLKTLSMLYSNSTTMHLSVLSRTLQPVSTAMGDMHGKGSFGQSIVPTITFQAYLARRGKSNDNEDKELTTNETTSDDKGDIEVLVVPGGGGTRQAMTSEIDFVKTIYPKLKHIISICTGATILARAGILDNRRATTNKRAWPWATSTGPNVSWVPTARWVEDGNIFSSSGISAGIDVMYAFVGKVYGEEVAEYLSLTAEYKREMDEHNDPYAGVWDVSEAV